MSLKSTLLSLIPGNKLARGVKDSPPETVAAHRKRDIYHNLQQYIGPIPYTDPILYREMSKVHSDYRYPFGPFINMLDRDPMVVSGLEQRTMAVLNRQRLIHPGHGDRKQADYAAAFVRHVLFDRLGMYTGDGGFQQDLQDFLRAVPLGIAFQEVVWARDSFAVPLNKGDSTPEREWKIPISLESRNPRMFAFDKDDRLLLLTVEEPMGIVQHPKKFMIFRPFTMFQDPYGYPMLRCLWWMVYFKRLSELWWMSFTERHGSPTAVATPEANTFLSSEDKTAITEILENIQQETGILLPAGVKMVFESAGTMSWNTYREFIDYCNDQIAMVLTGQTSTTRNAAQGNMNSAEVHERVAMGIQTLDARALEGLVNNTLIRWIMEENLPGYPVPRFEIVTDPPKNLQEKAEVYKFLADYKYPVPLSAVADEFGIPMAEDGEETLKAPEKTALAPSQERPAKTAQKAKERRKDEPAENEARPRP